MRKHKSPGLILMVLTLLASLTLKASGEDMNAPINIPFEKFTLKNGLTLIVHEDHKTPVVAVNVWYHVGSKNEKPGRTGFAHLFEHLMFNGSENANDDYFQVMEAIGATDLNGTTSEDRTNYFENVPTSALDLALFMESDRMGHMVGAIVQAKLDEQRGVVQNEKRQYENEPFGLVDELMAKSVFPAGHPYSWTVIGSMEDLSAAALEDVHEWFKTYYGPNNAVLVVAGDIDAKTALAKVEKYFGDIPPGPPISKHQSWIAKRTGSQRQILQDRVPQAKIYKVWNVPQRNSLEAVQLDLVSDVLALGKVSRLYKRLVYDEQLATQVQAYLDQREIASLFIIEATAKQGVELAKVEAIIDEELNKLLADGPTAAEVARVQTQFQAAFLRGIERIGGFGGKSDILAQNMVFAGNPEHYKTTLTEVRQSTPQSLHQAAKAWLSDGVYNLEVHPFTEYAAASEGVDRKEKPAPGKPPLAKFPVFKEKQLSNGMRLVVAAQPSVPVVTFNLMVDAGYAADQFALPGTAKLAMDMVDEGTKKRSSLQINEELANLGAQMNSGCNLDYGVVYLSALKEKLDESLAIYADVILNPAFPEGDFKRLQKLQLASIQREKVTPNQMALRVFPGLLFGKGHAYGNPFTGSGTEASTAKISREDLVKYHQTWFKPNNSTLVVVGATTLEEIAPKIEALFNSWQRGAVPQKNIGKVEQKPKSVVYIIDRPGSLQSIIFAGHVMPPKANPEEIAAITMNNVLGGMFTSRINMNLREDKHWTYGAGSFIVGAKAQRPFIVTTSVQTDKTSESMVEIRKELADVAGPRPISRDELTKSQDNQILELAGSWETMAAVSNSLSDIIRYDLAADYWSTYAAKIAALKEKDVLDAAKKMVKPGQVVWVVVGDRTKIEAPIREKAFGEIHFVDTDGNIQQ